MKTSLSTFRVQESEDLEFQIQSLLESLGEGHGHIDGVAYDTAWGARLALRYPGQGFEKSLEWLRRNQYADGTWGAPLVHYHDRYISTLAAIVALQEALKEGSGQPRDARRIKRGEDALWRLVGKLGRDDSDTVGFPILSATLAEEATELGLEVPQAPIRFAIGYKKKVDNLLSKSTRNWLKNPLVFSLEGLRHKIGPLDQVVSANNSVACCPAATSAYLLTNGNLEVLAYLSSVQASDGSLPALDPIDVFEITWALNHLRFSGAIEPDNGSVRKLLDYLWSLWSPTTGSYFSAFFQIPDLDITSASFILLRWGGYPVSLDAFEYFEMDDHFCTYREETNPSPGSHLRLLEALKMSDNHPKKEQWISKVLSALHRFDENGSYWSDKWHASPYYANHLATYALNGVDDDTLESRIKWILRTQNDDGGWGYLDVSTTEETAYSLDALLAWDRNRKVIDKSVFDRALEFIQAHKNDKDYSPLWISKGLYTPTHVVQAAILSALKQYYWLY